MAVARAQRALDAAVVGGGMLGLACAAELAQAGLGVTVFEAEHVGAGASGRNSGIIQHPLDHALAPLQGPSLAIYRELAEDGLALPEAPDGILLLGADEDALRSEAAAIATEFPALHPALIDAPSLARAEPALAAGLAAVRIETGWAVRPAAATEAMARRARRLGAEIREGTAAAPWVHAGRARGVTVDGSQVPAGLVVVAAGVASGRLAGLAPGALRALWGVTVQVDLAEPPSCPVEQAGVGSIADGATPPPIFSLVTAQDASVLGSTFDDEAPDAPARVPALVAAGARYVPELAAARTARARACPRPLSFDGRPLLGRVPGVEGLAVATGHGPWGISLGPHSARLVVGQLLTGEPIPAPYDVTRHPPA